MKKSWINIVAPGVLLVASLLLLILIILKAEVPWEIGTWISISCLSVANVIYLCIIWDTGKHWNSDPTSPKSSKKRDGPSPMASLDPYGMTMTTGSMARIMCHSCGNGSTLLFLKEGSTSLICEQCKKITHHKLTYIKGGKLDYKESGPYKEG